MAAPSTKQALLDAAVTVFTEKGLPGARVVDVTRCAGVSAGSFYTYFDSKEELFLAVVAQIRHDISTGLPRARIADADGARAWLENVARQQVARCAASADTWRVVNAAALGNVQIATALRGQSDPFADALTEEISFWIDRGWIDPGVSAAVAVEALVALTEQSVQQWCAAGRTGMTIEDVADEIAAAWSALLRLRAGTR